MKKLLALSVVLFSTSIWAQCANKIDNSKVMMFVDTNDSGLEILTAQKAACQRGQKLVVIPKAYKEYEKYVAKQTQAMKAGEACYKQYANDYEKAQKACKVHSDNFAKAMKETEEFKKSQPRYDAQIREEMESLRKSKSTLENFTISGHNGGGHFGGSKESFDKQQVASIMKDFTDVNKVKSVMLLGCYTGVQQEVIDWQITFPDVRMIGGYDGSAPLASRPQGHNYLYDLLVKEKILTTTADQKKLESIVKTNIRSLNELNAAMYLKPVCENQHDEKAYYYGKVGATKVFRKFDMQECLDVKKELLQLKSQLDKYDSGELEPPKDTAGGELRQIYNKARSHEHCAQIIGDVLDSNKVFGLLFYEGEKKNFSEFYDEEMKEAEKVVSELNIEELLKASAKGILDLESMYKLEEENLKLLESDPKAFEAKLEKDYQEAMKLYKDEIKDPKYKSLLEKLPYLKMEENANSVFTGGNSPLTEDELKLYNDLSIRSGNLSNPKYELENIKSDPAGYVAMKKEMLGYTKNNLEQQKLAVEKLKVENPLKEMWIPTKKNLEGKSRKEMLENLHKMNGVLSLPFLPNKQRSALMWVNMTTGNRLQRFDNPFSWHEHINGVKPEKPSFDMRLSDMLKQDYGNYGPGMYGGGFGGSVSGSGSGGGYIGGMGGGYGTGGTLTDDERPIH